MTVKQIRDELRKQKNPLGGNKNILVERLIEHWVYTIDPNQALYNDTQTKGTKKKGKKSAKK